LYNDNMTKVTCNALVNGCITAIFPMLNQSSLATIIVPRIRMKNDS
jgi:hypothetical protein